MNIIYHIARVIIGLVFVFSGFVKGVDPLGFTYKITDYLEAFHLSFFSPLAMTVAMIFIILEFTIGLCLLFGIRKREATLGAFIFILFFTILTLIIAFTNPVSDCGCFGDALLLSNWQTFYKNLVLLVLVMLIGYVESQEKVHYAYTGEWIWVGVFAFTIVSTSFFCYRHLPLFDFRPYYVGSYIPEKMQLPEGVLPIETKMLLYYEKDGVVEEFTEDNYPWQDSTWTWKETKTIVLKENEADIHDLVFTDTETGMDMTDSILQDSGYTYFLVAYDLKKAKVSQMKRANELSQWCRERGFGFYALTSTGPADIEQYKQQNGLDYAFANTDEITLKTIIRANPGIVILHKGTVIRKMHGNDWPNLSKWSDEPLADALNQKRLSAEHRLLWFFAGWLMLYVCAYFVYYRTFRKKKHIARSVR